MEQQYNKLLNNFDESSIYYKFIQDHYKYYNEYNTEKFVYFLQVGSFYEHYSWEVEDEDVFMFDKISKRTTTILNMKTSATTVKPRLCANSIVECTTA